MGSSRKVRRYVHFIRRFPFGLLLFAGCGQLLGIDDLQVADPDAGMGASLGSGGEAAGPGGSGGVSGTGSVQGSGGTPGTGGMVEGDMTVTGTIIDVWGHPVPNAVVTVDDQTVVSGDDGEFVFPNVAPMYDVELTIEVRQVGNLRTYGWVFEGLTRRDPTLQVYRGRTEYSEVFRSEIQNVDFTVEDRSLGVSFGSPDGIFSFEQSSAALQRSSYWEGPDSTAGTTHALLWENQADSELPARYVAYDAVTTALDTGADTSVRLDLTPDEITVLSISGTLGPTDVGTPELHVYARFSSGAFIPLLSESSVSNFTYAVPALEDASLALVGSAGLGFFGSAETRVLIDDVVPGQADLELRFPKPATLISPVDGTTDAPPDAELRWRNDRPVSVVRLESAMFYRALYIVTAANTTRLRTLSGSGFQVRPDEPHTWTVEHHGDFASVDAAAGPEGFLSPARYEELENGSKRGSAFYTSSAPRGITIVAP